jgi:glycosyltransferase involved in cell wall biosynthesis
LNKADYGYLNGDIKKPDFVEPLRIIFCGRITKSKKLELLIQALHLLHIKYALNFHCEIIGAGNASGLIEMVNNFNLVPKIVFLGAVYEKELSHHLLNADLMVYPGGIGLSIVQSLSYGIPVITTNREELQMPEIELLEPGKNGDLYEDGSAEDLAAKIIVWKNKIMHSRVEITNACLDSIREKGYLPEIVSENALQFLRKKLSS